MSLKAKVKISIGTCEVRQRTDKVEVVGVDFEGVCFTIEHDLIRDLYYDKSTRERLKTKKNTYGTWTNIYVNKTSFINQCAYKITVTRFDDGTYSVGYVVKTKVVKK